MEQEKKARVMPGSVSPFHLKCMCVKELNHVLSQIQLRAKKNDLTLLKKAYVPNCFLGSQRTRLATAGIYSRPHPLNTANPAEGWEGESGGGASSKAVQEIQGGNPAVPRSRPE